MQSDWINRQDCLKSEINGTENWEQEGVVPGQEQIFASNSNEKSAPIDWKRFSNFRRLRNLVARIEKREKRNNPRIA